MSAISFLLIPMREARWKNPSLSNGKIHHSGFPSAKSPALWDISINMDIREHIKRVLEKHMTAQDISMKALSKKAGLSNSGVANVKTAKMAPRIDTLIKIADALGISASEFVPGISDTPPVEAPENRQLIEDASKEVLIALVAAGIIPTMKVPVEQVGELIRGTWLRRSRRPDTTTHEIAIYIANELDLLTPKDQDIKGRVIDAVEEAGRKNFRRPAPKLN